MPEFWHAIAFTKYSTSSVVPVFSVQSRTFVGEHSQSIVRLRIVCYGILEHHKCVPIKDKG